MIRLIGIDLDETLLRRDKSVSARNKAVLEDAIRRGITIVPVTGRPLCGLPEAVRNIKGLKYVISSNGAVVTMLPGKRLRERLMDQRTVLDLIRLFPGTGLGREVFIDGMGYSDPHTYDSHMKRWDGHPFLDYIKKSRKVVPDLEAFVLSCGDSFENVCLTSDDLSIIDRIYESLPSAGTQGSGLSIARTIPRVIEIGADGADKGSAIIDLGVHLGISRDEMMAVGDSENDLELMRAVALPVAMSNASSAVRSLAVHITSDNEHDGVAEAVLRFTKDES